MPKLGKKKFAYTKKGVAAYKKAKKKVKHMMDEKMMFGPRTKKVIA